MALQASPILPNDAQMYADRIGTLANDLVILDIQHLMGQESDYLL